MISDQRIAILRKLRPPHTQPVKVVYTFSRAEPANWGLTLAVGKGVPLVAPGDGTVDQIAYLEAKWRNDIGLVRCLGIRIDHGQGVKTWVHGFDVPATGYGPVKRGQLLGYATQDQIFFGVEYNGTLQDPTHVNQHFGLMDGWLGYQKETKLRQAPDLLTTALTLIQSYLWQGIRYFFPPVPVPVLFNLNFNGHHDKTGPAQIGAQGDVWNDIPAIDFAPVGYGYYGYILYYGYCYGGVHFPAGLGFFLNDFRGVATKVYYERGLLTSAAGDTPFFDPMLSSWVGGYNGATPLLNSFTVRNLPAGVYDLYLYSNGGATSDQTTFYVSVNYGVPQTKTITPTGVNAWVEDENYAKFGSLTIPSRGAITVSAYGYLAGLQLQRQ